MSLLDMVDSSLNSHKLHADIITGDILEHVNTFLNGRFKLIITSPPYNIGKAYEIKQSLQNYLLWQEKLISEIPRILHEQGSVIWQVRNIVEKGEVYPLDIYFYPIFKKYGLKLRNRIIWHFDHGLHCKNRFSGRYETLIWFKKQISIHLILILFEYHQNILENYILNVQIKADQAEILMGKTHQITGQSCKTNMICELLMFQM